MYIEEKRAARSSSKEGAISQANGNFIFVFEMTGGTHFLSRTLSFKMCVVRVAARKSDSAAK